MTELRRVSYSLTGEGAPVVHLECLTMEQAREAYMLSTAVTVESAQAKMLDELGEWLAISTNHKKTVELWSHAFVRCGLCRHSWTRWLADNPVGEDWRSWLELARAKILENQWV